ncbi:p18 NS [Mahlapitsi orthoreovirus]|uniref:p18 NS n=1 Tax=Mahlapitsi orthoreovirus TaxID=2170064 RepID=A0A3G1DHN3_9REOV|nr:p18 NS [Mahlapitsi orthoreovirus]AMU04181.1 p18 NS [Mahlapitsi orthoreovirus]AMU04192.1 p18 NS [Mahlapitsi orthoreovirus]
MASVRRNRSLSEEKAMEIDTYFTWPASLYDCLTIRANVLIGTELWQEDMQPWMPVWIALKDDRFVKCLNKAQAVEVIASWVWKSLDSNVPVYSNRTIWLVTRLLSKLPPLDDDWWREQSAVVRVVVQQSLLRIDNVAHLTRNDDYLELGIAE